ncbi:hypothetical protein TUBRATIS_14180 [Tubulinosema ratisbonensis]|uniref:Uncharacterized protein n=1 Tax=Tubulinosema ratisbonensis TaxID=291195 RepID=A0A437ALM3_9MICR|nr:hypothetical protein TUBRATIS_14180 [Tubulinosema ratisbonensis]
MAKLIEMEKSQEYSNKEEKSCSSMICSSLGESYEFGNKEEDVKQRLHEISMKIGIKAYKNRKKSVNNEDMTRRRKKYVPFDLHFLKEIDIQEIYSDVEKIRSILGGEEFKVRIENKLLKTSQGNFKKNDRVRLIHEDKEELVVISWINTLEITFRSKEGEKIKYNVNDFLTKKVKIYKVKKNSE